MKKLCFILFLIFSFRYCTFADEIESVNFDELIQSEREIIEEKQEDVFEQPIILEPNEIAPELKEINPYSKEALRGIIEKDYDLNNNEGLFKEQLTLKYNKGIIKNTTFQLSSQMGFFENINKKDSDLKYDYYTLNFGLKGDFSSNKEKYFILFNLPSTSDDVLFEKFVLDAWISTKRIPNHTLTFGTYRPNLGYEATQSAFLLPFANRSQIARNFGNIRKTGLKITGDYKYFDYEIGGYSSDTWYREFFPGVETDNWINFKPLANFDKNKTGILKIGGGYAIGEKHSQSYNIASAGLKYDYKKLRFQSEFSYANGSNGASGLTSKERWGYNATLAYKITKKIECLLRFDDFDNDKKIAKNNSKEYSVGLNYYILGQALRLTLNYVFCQNQNKINNHKIIIGGQFLL